MKLSNLKEINYKGLFQYMRVFSCVVCFAFACVSGVVTVHAQSVNPAERLASELDKIPRVNIPKTPFLFVNQKEIDAARRLVEQELWAKTIKDNYVSTANAWIDRDYAFIKSIIPVKGSIYIYGLGLDLDPAEQKKMRWRGWEDPRHVVAANGVVYPNMTHPDKGEGWKDAKNNNYYFIALANGMTINKLETVELPALVNAFLLTGNEVYAERALWILDAIATIYPRAYEGPIDYPGNAPGKVDGGRLDRPYYQAARAMINYAYFAEALSTSAHSSKTSPSNPVYSMRKNIELNLLMNGADYCLRMAQSGKGASYELNNGNIDYNRAPLIVGAMLGIPEWIEWALNGPLGFRNAIGNTIDINGRYFETGTLYASHTRELMLSTAFFLKRMRLPAYPQGFEAYDDSRFAMFALDFFTGIQVAGRLPLFGDAGPDAVIIKDGRIFDRGTLLAAREFYRYTGNKEIRTAALQAAGKMIKNMPANYTHAAADIFHMDGWEEFKKQSELASDSKAKPRSSLFFDNGVLILRSGQNEKERAALVRFGPTLNHGQTDELGLAFYAKGREFSFDPGYYNTHFRFGFTTSTVAHNILVVNRRNQLRQASSGGDVQTWTDGSVLRSAAVDNPEAYADQGLKEYKRRAALIDLSEDDSYIIDNFWAQGGIEYDYSLHGIMRGKFQLAPSTGLVLKETRKGSILSPDMDYANDMDPNGRVKSLGDKPFYFAPPGDGFGFLSRPSFYRLTGPANMQWSATDDTGHNMYVSHFAPSSSELITAVSNNPRKDTELSYAVSHIKAPASQTVRFTSIILNTSGENKLASVEQLVSKRGNNNAIALRIIPAKGTGSGLAEHIYIAANKTTSATYPGGISFSGEEGFLGVNISGKAESVSLTGNGHLQKGSFNFTVAPLFQKPLQILKIEQQPLRLLVNASAEDTKLLSGSIVRLNRAGLARPFTLRVDSSVKAGTNSWLIMDASSNVHAIGLVNTYDDQTHTITTDSPFPHTRAYRFNYDYSTGSGGSPNTSSDYNGGYDGFWLVNSQKPQQSVMIKTIENKRTRIILDNKLKEGFKAGDHFEIQLLMPGDEIEVPVWAQAKRRPDGGWDIKGPAKAKVTE